MRQQGAKAREMRKSRIILPSGVRRYTSTEGNVRSQMSFRSKRELLAQVAPRYQQAGHMQKSVILDEFVAATGYARKYAIQLLAQPPLPIPVAIRRPRAPRYGSAVQAALEVAWAAANCVGTKRLIPF